MVSDQVDDTGFEARVCTWNSQNQPRKLEDYVFVVGDPSKNDYKVALSDAAGCLFLRISI